MIIDPAKASRLSGEPRAVAHYIRNAGVRMPRHLPSQVPQHSPLPQRGARNARRALAPVRLPKAPATRSLAPMTSHMYADMARRPFGKKIAYQSAKTASQALRGVAGPILSRYRLPLQILGQVISTGNIALAPNVEPIAKAFERSGWTRVCTSGGPVSLNPWNTSSGNYNVQTVVSAGICGAANQVPNAGSPMTGASGLFTSPASWRTIHIGPASNFVDRFHVHVSMTKGATQLLTRLRTAHRVDPAYAAPMPSLNPMALPIKLPVGTPVPIPYHLVPYRVNNPYRVEQSTGSQPSTRPLPRPVYTRGRWINVDEVIVTPGPRPGSKPVVRPEPGKVHVRRPPTTKERESKVVIRATVAKALLSVITESLDLLDAFFYSIDGKKPRNLRPYDKFVYVVENLDRVEIPTLVRNIIIQLIQDYLVGKFGRAQQEANALQFEYTGVDLQGHFLGMTNVRNGAPDVSWNPFEGIF